MLGSPSTHISPHLPAAMRAIFLFDFAVRWPQHREPDESCTERHALVLRTRPPVGEEGEEVGCAETSQLEPTGALFRRGKNLPVRSM